MIRIDRRRIRNRSENTIALINVVFLLLIFFLIAGTLAPPIDSDLSLIASETAEATDPPDAMVVTAEGALRYRGLPTTPQEFLDARRASGDGDGDAIRIVADRRLAAARLLEVVAELRAHGAGAVGLVTERGAP